MISSSFYSVSSFTLLPPPLTGSWQEGTYEVDVDIENIRQTQARITYRTNDPREKPILVPVQWPTHVLSKSHLRSMLQDTPELLKVEGVPPVRGRDFFLAGNLIIRGLNLNRRLLYERSRNFR